MNAEAEMGGADGLGAEQKQPTCPCCGSHDVEEIAKVEAIYSIEWIDYAKGDDPAKCSCEYSTSRYSDDGEFVGYECRDCTHETESLGEFIEGTTEHVHAKEAEATRVRLDGPETAEGGLIGQQPY